MQEVRVKYGEEIDYTLFLPDKQFMGGARFINTKSHFQVLKSSFRKQDVSSKFSHLNLSLIRVINRYLLLFCDFIHNQRNSTISRNITGCTKAIHSDIKGDH